MMTENQHETTATAAAETVVVVVVEVEAGIVLAVDCDGLLAAGLVVAV